MALTFLYADPHYLHSNIMKFCGRTIFMTPEEKYIYLFLKEKGCKFCFNHFRLSKESVIKQTEMLVYNWNARVRPEDTTIINGDFAFTNSKGGKEGEGLPIHPQTILDRLNGNKVMIRGNHDRSNKLRPIIDSMVIKTASKVMYVVHDPRKIDFRYEINLTGHVHEKWAFARIDKRLGVGAFGEYKINQTKERPDGVNITDCINVGVDVNKFCPRTINELLGGYMKWKKEYESKEII